MAEFEKTSVSAFRQVFGNMEVSGCLFHYSQAIRKCVQKLGLKEPYHNIDEVNKVLGILLHRVGSGRDKQFSLQ